MFFSWESAMREVKRVIASGGKARMVKTWYGWRVQHIIYESKHDNSDLIRMLEIAKGKDKGVICDCLCCK